MKTLLLAVAVLLVAMLVGLAGCGEARQGGYDYVAEPRRVPKPKICSDYANERQILLDEQAGRLTKADKQWLDMDGDGRYCEERGVEWKGERTQAQ
jgi:type IV pilus biogenesis protein CpaD/CtpE